MKASEKPAPREASKRQRIEIFTMLAEVYDLDAGRYKKGETDDTVAEVLGVMPGWVSQIRDAEFGPDGGNGDMEALAAVLTDMQSQLEANAADCKKMITDAQAAMAANDKRLADVKSMKADLESIKKAVGPRILAKAGVS